MIYKSSVVETQLQHIIDGEVNIFIQRTPFNIFRLPNEPLRAHYTCVVRVGDHHAEIAATQDELSSAFFGDTTKVDHIINLYYAGVR